MNTLTGSRHTIMAGSGLLAAEMDQVTCTAKAVGKLYCHALLFQSASSSSHLCVFNMSATE